MARSRPPGTVSHARRQSYFTRARPRVDFEARSVVNVDGRENQMASAAETISRVSVAKLHPLIGAEIGGVDLRRSLDDETVRQIKDAWHRHTVLVFRDQGLSEDDQRRFASYFGPIAKRVARPSAKIVPDGPDW